MEGVDNALATTIDLKHLLETVQPPEKDFKTSKNEKLIADDLPDFNLAYLGPHLWSDTVMSDDLKLEPINLDDLFDDGSLSRELADISSILSDQGTKNSQPKQALNPQSSLEVSANSSDVGKGITISEGQNFAVPTFDGTQNFMESALAPVPKLPPPQAQMPALEDEENKFSYKPDLTDVLISTPMDEAEASCALFDPTKRVFTEEELKPQPIIRKAKKVYVSDDSKDAQYWRKREKNNAAAKRSRAARRIKENQIAMRTTFLEKENDSLRQELKEVRAELQRMIEAVKGCEARV